MMDLEFLSPLLAPRLPDGTLPYHPYKKWVGAQWTLYALALAGWPEGDASLVPLRDQSFKAMNHREQVFRKPVQGRKRLCGSMDAIPVWTACRLGIADQSVEPLVDRLLEAQWPDGGWNCDRHPEASHSSFHETVSPLRALAAWQRISGDPRLPTAIERAAEVFLSRRLFRRQSTGEVILPEFLALHFPAYWHYDVLGGLLALAEAGFISDPRCAEALDWLESKRLPDGGFAREARFDRRTQPEVSGYSPLDWGPTSARRANPWVTRDAEVVLRAAGRA